MLLEGQCPRVRKESQVHTQGDDYVGEVGQGGTNPCKRRAELAAQHSKPGHADRRDDERGIEPQEPTEIEASESDPTKASVFIQQERRDQEPAEDEEDVHARKAVRADPRERVVGHHGNDCQPAQPVQGGPIRG